MKGINIHIRQVLSLAVMVWLPFGVLLSQHVSKNNYTGYWETPTSWNPEWPVPQIIILGYDITVNGYITARSSLDFTGSANNLIVNDTLVIQGSLTVNNNNKIQINDGGILIVRGNLIMENQSSVIANGYFVVTGSLTKTSSTGQGSFLSNDNPVKVFIGGSITPSDLVNNKPGYPVLNCTTKPTIPYQYTSCSYGNNYDLEKDPVYSFFLTTCVKPTLVITNPSPVCAPSTVDLTASSVTAGSTAGLAYSYWTNSAATIAYPTPAAATTGTYYIKGITSSGCSDIKPVNVVVAETPAAIPGPDQELYGAFETNMDAVLGNNQTGEWILISGSGKIIDIHSPVTKITELKKGKNIFRWTVSNGTCQSSSDVNINVNELFVPNVITPNGDGKNDYFRISAANGRVELTILNRWGNVEYSDSNYLNDWNGKNNNGEDLSNDTYYYVLKFENGQLKKGTVLITR